MHLRSPWYLPLLTAALAACSPEPNGVLVTLSPDVISSIDGTAHVRALIVDDRSPVADQAIRISVLYADRNGIDHAIAPVDGVTDSTGAFEVTLEGLDWEGTGEVTAEVVDAAGAVLMSDGAAVAGTASFAVLDRTPPTVRILPPTSDLRVGPGLPLQVAVEVTDEIGVSEVFIEASGELDRSRSTVVASGATTATVTFDFDIPNDARSGPTITLYALAGDLSGNLAAAEPVVLIVDPAISIATPAGLDGGLLTDGSPAFLENPTALAVSPRDGLIYVTDNAGGSPCNGACIRVVDPADGSVRAGAVVVGNGTLEGIAFDATGDNLYYTDRQDRVMRLTYNAGAMAYQNATACNIPGNQNPVDPYHLVVDATLGLLVADDDSQLLKQHPLACTGDDPQDFTPSAFDSPRGVALGASGEIYVSDDQRDEVFMVDRANGDVTRFETRRLDRPHGLEWLGGSSDFADSLLVANRDGNTVLSTRGDETSRPVAYLRNDPVDVALAGGTLYVLTEQSAGNRGRIFVVTGF
jgi:hypothetical protein